MAKTCQFGALEDDLLRDRIICGIRENGLRKRLLQESALPLKRCVDMCRAAETTVAQTKVMNAKDEIHRVGIDGRRREQEKRATDPKKPVGTVECKFCGRQHDKYKYKCPAYGKTCANCGKENHFARKCKSTRIKARGKEVNQVEDNEYTSSDDEPISDDEYCFTVSKGRPMQRPKAKIFAKMLVEGKTALRFQVDSGATCNIIRKRDLPSKCKVEPVTRELNMYNGSSMKPLGKCQLMLLNPKNNMKYKAEFIVVNEDTTPLLGSTTVQEINFIEVKYENIAVVNNPHTDISGSKENESEKIGELNMDDIVQRFPDMFDGEGTFERKLHLEVDETITPVKQPLRKVPIAIKPTLKVELARLEKLGIIKPVDEPTDWVSSLVLVKKPNGKLRICIDPKPLNKALKRSHYPLPVIDDILPELSQAKVFSVGDVKNGFWNVELHNESSYLTTFGTPFGRFR